MYFSFHENTYFHCVFLIQFNDSSRYFTVVFPGLFNDLGCIILPFKRTLLRTILCPIQPVGIGELYESTIYEVVCSFQHYFVHK